VEMTAEVANGWFPFLFIPEKAAGVWGKALDAPGAPDGRRASAPSKSPPAGWWAIGEGLEHYASWPGV